jgi:hypothetical protein
MKVYIVIEYNGFELMDIHGVHRNESMACEERDELQKESQYEHPRNL